MKISLLTLASTVAGVVTAAPSGLETRQSTGTNLYIPLQLSYGSSSYSYIGCYADVSTRILATTASLITASSSQDCVNKCGAKGYKYAAIEYGHECYCGNWWNTYGTVQPSWECNYKCEGAGWSGYACGGFWRAQVYALDTSTKVYGTQV